MRELLFMGIQRERETFRARVYDGVGPDADERYAFVRALDGGGVVDCPGFDPWINVLREKGWLRSTFEQHSDPAQAAIGMRQKRWFLNHEGRVALEPVLSKPR